MKQAALYVRMNQRAVDVPMERRNSRRDEENIHDYSYFVFGLIKALPGISAIFRFLRDPLLASVKTVSRFLIARCA